MTRSTRRLVRRRAELLAETCALDHRLLVSPPTCAVGWSTMGEWAKDLAEMWSITARAFTEDTDHATHCRLIQLRCASEAAGSPEMAAAYRDFIAAGEATE